MLSVRAQPCHDKLVPGRSSVRSSVVLLDPRMTFLRSLLTRLSRAGETHDAGVIRKLRIDALAAQSAGTIDAVLAAKVSLRPVQPLRNPRLFCTSEAPIAPFWSLYRIEVVPQFRSCTSAE